MNNNKIWKTIISVLLFAVFIMSLAACTGNEPVRDSVNGDSTESMNSELSPEDKDALMHQVAGSESSKGYEEYLPEEVFADAEIFGIDRDGAEGTAYTYLTTSEFAVLKGKAYQMSGSSGPAIIRFRYSEEGIELKEVEWSADGSDHDSWIKEHFPEAYYEKNRVYEAYDADGRNKLLLKIQKEVEKTMGVPVEADNLLTIDMEKGTYEVIKTIETGKPGVDYKFDTEVVDEGSLSDLAAS